jgi:hypothetical protein
LLLQTALVIQIEDGRCGSCAELRHQRPVCLQLAIDRRGNVLHRLDAVSRFMLVQGRGRIVRSENGGGLSGAVCTQDADHDVPQLHLARFHPGPRLLPEHAAVRAVGVGEGVDHAFGVVGTVTDPGAGFQLRPGGPGHGLIHQFIKMRAAEVIALGIQQGPDQDVLLVLGEVEGQALAVVFSGKPLQAAGGVETADDLDAELGRGGDGCGPVLGACERREREQQHGECVSCAETDHGCASFSSSAIRWDRLAADNSPR